MSPTANEDEPAGKAVTAPASHAPVVSSPTTRHLPLTGVTPSRRAPSPSTSTRHLSTHPSTALGPAEDPDDDIRVQIESKLRVLFQVLGGVRVAVDGLDLGITGQPQRLLGVLLAERDRVVSTDLLVERLWPDQAPATAAKVVHVLVGRLRRALEPELARAADSQVIRKAGGGYVLSTGPTDLDRYLELAEGAAAKRGSRPDEALALAAEALDRLDGAAVGRPGRRGVAGGSGRRPGGRASAHRGALGRPRVVLWTVRRFDRPLPGRGARGAVA